MSIEVFRDWGFLVGKKKKNHLDNSPFIDRVDKGIASLWKEEKAKYHMDEDRVNERIPCFISKTSRLALAEHR